MLDVLQLEISVHSHVIGHAIPQHCLRLRLQLVGRNQDGPEMFVRSLLRLVERIDKLASLVRASVAPSECMFHTLALQIAFGWPSLTQHTH